MTPLNISALEQAIRDSWGEDTCDPVDLPWSADNPSRGQCGVTALVLHDLLAGDLVLAEVCVGGARVGVHWWNRLGENIEIDLTRDQFRPDETVLEGTVVKRPAGAPGHCREQYETLRERVLQRLSAAQSV